MAELDSPSSEDIKKLLSKPWQKFLAKFDEINYLKTSQWKEVHILGFLCQQYENLYGTKFGLSFKGAPSKCPEIYLIKKIFVMLNTTNPRVVREYIEWVFKWKIEPKKIKFRTLGFFTTPGFANEFAQAQKQATKIVKSTNLPVVYKQVAETLNIPIITYGDLAFAKMALDQSPNSESRAPYRVLFQSLVALGFDTSILNNL